MSTTYHVTLFGLEFTIDRVAFTLPIGENGWPVYWYGILISLGFLLALVYGLRNAKRFRVDPDRLIDCVLVSTLCAIIGARVYFLLFDGNGIAGLKNFFAFHDGGLAIYGGVIAAVIAATVMCKLRKISLLDTLDLAALGFLIGQAIGRWGNFFNQEAFGKYISGSYLPKWFGMTSEAVADYYYEGVMVHPCFLYESLWCILGFILLHIFSKHRKFSGQIALAYGIWYGFGRFFIEGLRTDSLMLGMFRVSQVVSAILVIACSTLMIFLSLRNNRKDIPDEYTPMFENEIKAENISDSDTSDPKTLNSKDQETDTDDELLFPDLADEPVSNPEQQDEDAAAMDEPEENRSKNTD